MVNVEREGRGHGQERPVSPLVRDRRVPRPPAHPIRHYDDADRSRRSPTASSSSFCSDGKIAEIGVSDHFIQGKLKEPLPDGKSQFVTTRVDPEFAAGAAEIRRHATPGRSRARSCAICCPGSCRSLLFFGVWTYLGARAWRQAAWVGGLMSIGKSKAKVYVETDTDVTLRRRRRRRRGQGRAAGDRRLPEGPGATTAGSAGGCRRACCWSARPAPARRCSPRRSPARPGCRSSRSPAPSSSRCSSASAPRGCATCSSRRARRRPAIIFIDELDALGRARGIGPLCGGHDEKEQTLNQLLVELDGFDSAHRPRPARRHQPPGDPRSRAAARRPLRPAGAGRPAGQEGPRRRSCRCTCARCKLAPDVDLEKVAALTPGFTGADLANLVNEAALLATRRGADAVTHGRLQQRDRAHRRRPRKAQPAAQPAGARDRRLSRDGPRAGRAVAARHRSRCTRSRSSRAASARSATRSSGRPRTAS